MPDVWTPGVDRATGVLIASAMWNELLGADGSLNFLGTTHDHSGDAGDGVTLGLVDCLAAGIYPLGQKGGGALNVWWIEVKHAAPGFNGSMSATASVTWDNAFTATIGCVWSLGMVSGAGNKVLYTQGDCTFLTTGASVVLTTLGDGVDTASIYFIAIGY